MYDYISNDINYPVLKSVVKYKDHPRFYKPNSLFKFSNVEKEEILNEIVNLDA